MGKSIATTSQQPPTRAPYIDRGEPLVRAYAVNRIVALVRDPEHIFVYWDIDTEVRVEANPLLLRIHCVSEQRAWDLETPREADNWYFHLTPDRTYLFELYEKRPDGARLLATSREATTPRRAGEAKAALPAEIIHAEIHPMARSLTPWAGKQAAKGEPVIRRHIKRPQRAMPAPAPSREPHRAAPEPGALAPTPVAAPVTRPFSGGYTSSPGG